MTQAFETIEVQTTALLEAYEPTKLQLQSLLPRSEALLKAVAQLTAEREKANYTYWKQIYDDYNKYEKEMQEYIKNTSNFWNKVTRKKFTKPAECFNPGELWQQHWYRDCWYLQYGIKNLVKVLIEECNEALISCTYSHEVKMTAEQLQRVEYFRSGKALEDAIKWLEKKPEQF